MRKLLEIGIEMLMCAVVAVLLYIVGYYIIYQQLPRWY
jgi:hypothetical protein